MSQTEYKNICAAQGEIKLNSPRLDDLRVLVLTYDRKNSEMYKDASSRAI